MCEHCIWKYTRVSEARKRPLICNGWQLICKCWPHSVQNLLSTSLLAKNINVKMYRYIILTVVLCGCEIWCLTLREENRLRIFDNRVLRKVLRPKRDEVTGEW